MKDLIRIDKKNHLYAVLFLLLCSFSCIAQQEQMPSWTLGPFVRPANVNPILSPRPQSKFLDPMSKKQVAWEASDVFNPAAAIRQNKIYVLYRAEDRSGIGIGMRTSRDRKSVV